MLHEEVLHCNAVDTDYNLDGLDWAWPAHNQPSIGLHAKEPMIANHEEILVVKSKLKVVAADAFELGHHDVRIQTASADDPFARLGRLTEAKHKAGSMVWEGVPLCFIGWLCRFSLPAI